MNLSRCYANPIGSYKIAEMANLNKALPILERGLAEWRKQETLRRGKTSVSKFADFLEYSQTTVSMWLNKDRDISEEVLMKILPKLSEILGVEIYDELEIERPDALYQYVIGNWKDTPKEEQERIAKIIEKETKRPIPNEPKTKPRSY